MLLKRDFSGIQQARFRQDCGFLPEELEIFNMAVTGMTITEISFRTNLSEATVNRRIRRIKERIERVL